MNILLKETAALLEEMDALWAVCGGFALDLFLGKEIRRHSDIDICVCEKDREKILQYVLRKGWTVYEFRGQGKVRPLGPTVPSEMGRNLMCIKDQCEFVQFYPCEEEGLLYHEFFHIGITRLNYLEFLFNQTDSGDLLLSGGKVKCALSEAILHRNGIPYLAPEVALLIKASRADNAEYQLDFEMVYPQLNSEQRKWFIQKMDILYPNGHVWRK